MFKGLGGNLGELLEQAGQLQGKIEEMKAEAAQKQISASAGGGMVTVTMNGKQEVTAVVIDPSIVSTNDLTMLQDLVQAATNEAIRKSQAILKEQLSQLTGGLPIPGFGV